VKPQRVVLGGYGFGGDTEAKAPVMCHAWEMRLDAVLLEDVNLDPYAAAVGAMATAFAPWCAINVRLCTISATVSIAHRPVRTDGLCNRVHQL